MDTLMPFNKIVVGVDGSAEAEAALRWAVRLAAPLEAAIVAVHVVDVQPHPVWSLEAGMTLLPDVIEDGIRAERARRQQLLESGWTASPRKAGVWYRSVLVDGHAAEEIMRVAEAEHADVIVVGRCGHGSFTELVVGSVSHQLVHHAHTPVVVVPHAGGQRHHHRRPTSAWADVISV